MLKVGLTGGIGAGKSAVAAELARLGAQVIDADVLSREVVAPGGDGLREVVARFGAGVLCADGSLDRTALGARVFGDPAARRDLEAIIHPRVRARTAQLVAAAPDDAIVVNDVPLLVETGLAPGYHLVVVVTAAEATRVERLVSARSMAPADAYARIRAQADEASRRAAADALLVNDGSLEDLRSAVRALWLDRLVPFEANLREGRPAARPAAPVVVDPDPDWPARAHRLIARFAAAAGAGGLLRIDHVGSTAVPGLPARDIIDIQAVVADADAAAMLAAAGRAAGFVPAAGRSGPAVPHPGAIGPVRGGLPKSGPADGGPVNGGHGGYPLVEADPGCPVTIVLRPADDLRWREALLLRDWLRADTRQRDAFAAAKRDLAGWPGLDLVGYDRATAQWMWTSLPLARTWAVETGWDPER